jgi:hypothetical protein
MDTETSEDEKMLPVQEAPRKTGKPPLIMMNSTTIIIRLQNELKDHFRGQYEFRIHGMEAVSY